jgi:enoyl-CoA hydratase/carnithine racemase
MAPNKIDNPFGKDPSRSTPPGRPASGSPPSRPTTAGPPAPGYETRFDGNGVTATVRPDGRVGEMLLNTPAKLNPLSTETLRSIEHAARWFDTHDDLRVVVVKGAGKAFSAGASLTAFDGRSAQEDPRHDSDAGWRMARAMDEMRCVTVAQLHGWCVGGGLVVAAGCDLRVAANDARFSIPEIDLGIPLAWGGIPRLVREIGPAATKELVMTCRPFGAEEALKLGFLNRVVAAADLERAVTDLAETLAAKPKLALLSTKTHVNAVTESMVSTGRSWSDADGLLAGLRDPEGRASAAAYLERVQKRA